MASDKGDETGTNPRNDAMHAFISDGVLFSRTLRTGDGIAVARHRYRPVEVAVPDLPGHSVSLHLNGPNGVVQWRDGRVEEWVEYPGEIAVHSPGWSPVVLASLAVSDDLNVLLDDRFVRAVAAEAGEPAHFALADRSRWREPHLERLLLAFLPELDSDGFGGRLYLDALATALTVHLLRHHSTLGRTAVGKLACVPGGSLPDGALRRVTEYLEAYLDQALGLAELAAVAGYSPRHFARLFRGATGLSPHQYVIRRRVERAKLLLATTNLPLARVALDVGFAHQSHLAAHFRRLVGVSPARYRR